MSKNTPFLANPILPSILFILLVIGVIVAFWNVKFADPMLILVLILPLLGMFGVILVLIWLALIMGANDMAHHPHAFGLPAGSIRAMLALSLVVVFISTSLYFVGKDDAATSVAVQSIELPKGTTISDTDFESFLEDMPAGVRVLRTTVDGTAQLQIVNVAASQAKIDMAKQVLTVVATALVTVIGFYFGSRTSSAVTGDSANALMEREDRKKTEASMQAEAGQADQIVGEIENIVTTSQGYLKTTNDALAKSDPAGKNHQKLTMNAGSAAKAVDQIKTTLAEAKALRDEIKALAAGPGDGTATAANSLKEKLNQLRGLRIKAETVEKKAEKAATKTGAVNAVPPLTGSG